MGGIFEGRVIAVTGALGVLGAAVAEALRTQGARVALIDRAESAEDPPAVDRALLGGVDLAEPESAEAAMAWVVQHFGALDALVNVAGGFRWETVGDGSLDTWDLLYRINVRTAVAASRAALPHLLARGGGRIVNVGALGALKAATGMGAYAASKAGVMRFTEALAEELKDRAITVNAVLPSIIDTPQNRRDMPDADFSRWVSPAALAEVILFLLGPGAAAVTGALIPVPGRV
jgi:NAD(P)-dependent dehydrogenase (short-subunit alcohol dehydrogenase family)